MSREATNRGKKPDVIFVFSDQHRACDCGYASNPDVKTPNMDRLAEASVRFTAAVSGMPVCCPYRASLMTGTYPQTHGVFVNDVSLFDNTRGRGMTYLAEAYKTAGYQTAYIGKWHLEGKGRSAFIPEDRHLGFDYWKVLECTHDYNNSVYYEGGDARRKKWEGYDAIAQTDDAVRVLKERDPDKPLFLMLSWGPPHDPYDSAPKAYRDFYAEKELSLRPNVSEQQSSKAKEMLRGYYAHISALDEQLGRLTDEIERQDKREDTIFVYTSDHGDMLMSHGLINKQQPYEESIRVPFLLRYPRKFGKNGRECARILDTPDIMPTLLTLCGILTPKSVEGKSVVRHIKDGVGGGTALLSCIHPFGQYAKKLGGREYRGIRTTRYSYVADLDGDWLLFDNLSDPYQMKNLIAAPAYKKMRPRLRKQMLRLLKERGDAFLPGENYIKQWGYIVDENGTVPYED